MGLADLLGIEDLHCQKVEGTKWLKHKVGAMLGGQWFEQTNGRSGFCLASLSGACRGYMPPRLKTKQSRNSGEMDGTLQITHFLAVYMGGHNHLNFS